MANRAYSDPEGDVEITTPYRGDIRCRKLVVSQTGSVVGNIEAHDVRNFGRIHGVVNASDVFINADGARVRGSVFAPHLGIHPNSVFEANGSNSRRFEVDASPVSPSAIEAAVQEGLRRELTKRGLGADDQGFSISQDDRFARRASDRPEASLEQTHFMTPDGAVWPHRPQGTPVALEFAPPGRGEGVVVEETPSEVAAIPVRAPAVARAPVARALPPLFATDK